MGVPLREIKAYQIIVGKRKKRHISVREAYEKVENIHENGGRVRDVV